MIKVLVVFVASVCGSQALAADAVHGRALAQDHCTPCHDIGAGTRNEVANAPPFTAIARRLGFNPDAIAGAILGPHPKMNFSLRPAEAADLAAYIATLER